MGYDILEDKSKTEILIKKGDIMNEPLVSIVTPCYNGEQYLDRFFQSIIKQTYSNLELIFVNDGSTDETERVVSFYQNALVERGIRFMYQYQENAGQAAALNLGLKLFTGEYLACIDSDDEIMPDYIKKKVEFLQEHPECVYCYGKAISVREEEPAKVLDTYEQRTRSGRLAFFEDILFVRDVFFPGYLIKTSAIDYAIPKREIYSGAGGQNAQVLLPMAWYFGEPGYVEESVYKYYIRENSHSHSQNTCEKVIKQLYYYETILIETLRRIPDENAWNYIEIVKKYYVRLRFGNAVDTKRADLVRKHYLELKEAGIATKRDFALFVKYTNRLFRKIFRVR